MGIIAQRSNPVADFFGDVNLPAASFGKKEQETAQQVQAVEDEPVGQEPREVEYVFKRAYFDEGPEGFGFNRKCFVVREGSFQCETLRTRIQGELVCESDAGVEKLGCFAEGYADRKTGTARLEVTLYVGNGYDDLTRTDPQARCRYKLIDIHHSRGDRVIESEPWRCPSARLRVWAG